MQNHDYLSPTHSQFFTAAPSKFNARQMTARNMLDVRASAYLNFFVVMMLVELETMVRLLFWQKSAVFLVHSEPFWRKWFAMVVL